MAVNVLIDGLVKRHTSKGMQDIAHCIRTLRDWSEAMAVTSTGDKRKQKEVAMAATKMKDNIRSGFIWSSYRPVTFTIVLNFERDYSGNTMTERIQ